MRVLLLSELNSVHTHRWAKGLSEAGVGVHVCSLYGVRGQAWVDLPGVEVTILRRGSTGVGLGRSGRLSKLERLTAALGLRRLIRAWKPDLLHSHWATTHGGLAALSGFRPRLLSVWGSDVLRFPKISPLHTLLIRAVLARQDHVLSTSHCMAREVRALTKTPVEVIHWGVDTTRFCPEGARAYLPQRNERALPIVTVGSVKRLEPIYGVMDLTRAFLLARERLAGRIDLRLVLVGGGSQRGAVEEELEAAGQRGAAHMAGDVCYEEVPGWQRSLDVFCALSLEESYGVAVAEAKSCGRPVIVSDAPGFLELVTDGADGVVVRKRHPEAAAREIMRLALDPSLRSRLGGAGRRHVLLKLKWATTIRRTLDTYEGLLAGR